MLAQSLEAISKDNWLHIYMYVGRDKTFDGGNDITELWHNAFATSASSNKTAFEFLIDLTLITPLNLLMIHGKQKTM